MKTKIIWTGLAGLLILSAILSIVNAEEFSVTQPSPLSKSSNETYFIIRNLNTTSEINVTVPEFGEISDGDNHRIVLHREISTENGVKVIGNLVTIPPGNSTKVTITYTLEPSSTNLEDLALGTFSKSVVINKDHEENKTVTIDFISTYCDEGEKKEEISEGERYLEIISVRDKSSDNDWEWKPLDEVEIEVKVKFVSDDKDDDIDGIIKLGLYDTETKEFVDLENEEDLERDISLDEGERTTERFVLKVPVEDVEDSKNRYKLYVKVYEEDREEEVCTSTIDSEYFKDIEIKKESHEVILKDMEVTSPVPCDEEVSFSALVYNIGSNDEDKVQVVLENKELNLDLESETFPLDEGDSYKVEFDFKVPKGSEEKIYKLKAYALYRYRESTDTFREKSDTYDVPLKVEGNCEVEVENASVDITASLDPETPEAIAGDQVIIKATLINTGNKLTTYILTLAGEEEWADLISIEPNVVTLEPGASKNVDIVLNIHKDVEGEKEFNLKASYEGKVTEQKIALEVKKQEVQKYQSLIIEHLKENWFIYLIILVNLILIIAIIIVVKRIASHPPAP